MNERKLFKKTDALIIFVIIMVTVMLLLMRLDKYDAISAYIYSNGNEISVINLSEVKEPYSITVEDRFNSVITVEKGRIKFESAQCKDKICVSFGWLTKSGDMAACLPSETIIILKGNKDSGKVDVITY